MKRLYERLGSVIASYQSDSLLAETKAVCAIAQTALVSHNRVFLFSCALFMSISPIGTP